MPVICHKYKCIFIHIPKCAGTTVEHYFEELGSRRYYDVQPLPVLRREGLAKAINLYPHYFTFTFVRNPYARFISFYFFGLHLAACRNEHAGYDTLHECIELVRDLLPIEHREDLEGRRFGPHGTSNISSLVYAWLHSKHQTDHVLDCNPSRYFGVPRINNAPCSFIGRQETFARDFECWTSSAHLGVLSSPSTSWAIAGTTTAATTTTGRAVWCKRYTRAILRCSVMSSSSRTMPGCCRLSASPNRPIGGAVRTWSSRCSSAGLLGYVGWACISVPGLDCSVGSVGLCAAFDGSPCEDWGSDSSTPQPEREVAANETRQRRPRQGVADGPLENTCRTRAHEQNRRPFIAAWPESPPPRKSNSRHHRLVLRALCPCGSAAVA